jgi:hypothetical protein
VKIVTSKRSVKRTFFQDKEHAAKERILRLVDRQGGAMLIGRAQRPRQAWWVVTTSNEYKCGCWQELKRFSAAYDGAIEGWYRKEWVIESERRSRNRAAYGLGEVGKE